MYWYINTVYYSCDSKRYKHIKCTYWYINAKILDVYTCVKYSLEKKTFIYDFDTSYKNSNRSYD